MHSFRLRYIALGLLIYIQSAFSRTCVRDFDDVPSMTYKASIVFIGTAHRETSLKGLDIEHGYRRFRFRVIEVLKGEKLLQDDMGTEAVNNSGGGAPGEVVKQMITVDVLSTPLNDGDGINCGLTAVRVQRSSKYIVFLQRNKSRYSRADWSSPSSPSDSSDGIGESSVVESRETLSASSPSLSSAESSLRNGTLVTVNSVVYRVSSGPVILTDQARKEAKASKGKGRKPKVTKMSKSVEVRPGKKVRLHCRAAGKPKPRITWFKDGAPLQHHDRIRIVENEKGSQLTISRSNQNDSATYHCEARNVLGTSPKNGRNSTLLVIDNIPEFVLPPHSRRCSESDSSYCLNGGMCFLMPKLKQNFCICINNYIGTRCEEKNTGMNVLMTLDRDTQNAHEDGQI